MRILLLLIVSLTAAFGIGIFLEEDAGRVILSYAGVAVQTSFVLFVVLMIAIFILLHVLFIFFAKLLHMPRDYRRWRNYRKHLRSEKFLHQGCLDLLEANWSSAENNFSKGAGGSRSPLLNYLFAARAAQHQNAVERRDLYLKLAYECSEDHSLATELTQAELQLQQQQHEQAHTTLMGLHTRLKPHKHIKLMLLDTSARLGKWQQVLELLPELARTKALSDEQIASYRIQAFTGLLSHSVDRPDLQNIWRKIPRKSRRELKLVEAYCKEALRHADHAGCESLLRQTLKKQYDSGIVRLYGLAHGTDTARQLAFAEGLYKNHPGDPVLMLTLGRLCSHNRLWGKARTYLKDSLAAMPIPETYRELARLYETEGETRAATDCYRAGLEAVTHITN